MKVFSSIIEIRKYLDEQSESQLIIGFVPTMGALHEGHLSLVKQSLLENEITLVSIYINPTQFDNSSDFKNYPHHLESDISILESLSSDNLFLLIPEYKDIYPDDYAFKVSENNFSRILCGKFRKGHFDGVLTIVLKLLNISGAQKAYFGEKDFQQLTLIKDMVHAFFVPIKIIACPIVREQDGLAMSSRNKRLSEEQRRQAPEIYKVLNQNLNKEKAEQYLHQYGIDLEYLELHNNRKYIAANIGEVRLIDNIDVKEEHKL